MATTDIAVIGAGAAGRGLASIAVALGLRVTLFERGPMGGEAPDPDLAAAALRAAAARAALLRDASRLGVGAGGATVDWLALRAHLAAADADAAPDLTADRFEAMGVELVRAAARFAGPDTVAAGGREWRFRRALVAAGAEPVVPALPGLEAVDHLTARTVHALEAGPDHLLVLGGTARGLETAQAFARLGARATVIAPTRVAPGFDPELVEGLSRVLRRDGVALLEGYGVARVERGGAGVILLLADGTRVEGSHLLLDLGDAPRLRGLDLRAAGLDEGLAVDGALRVRGGRRVWAAGGVVGRDGAEDLGILARSMLFRAPGTPAPAPPLRAIRTEPAIVEIGAPAEGDEILRRSLADTPRAAAERLLDGLVKLRVDRRGRLTGAGLLAPGGLEMAGTLALALGRPVSELAAARLPGPALTAAITRAAFEHQAPIVARPSVRWMARLAGRLP